MPKKTQKIKFHAFSEHTLEVRQRPVPAASLLPQWWRDIPPYTTDKFQLMPAPNVTSKKCFPLLDGMSSGYIMPLWADIMVENQEGIPFIKFINKENVVEEWPQSQLSSYQAPDGFFPKAFKYIHGWGIETPPGYSCLFTHPVAYPDTPFRTITGVVDTDRLNTEMNSPFFIKKGFSGIIEKGTPMFQVIPFKRENWESEIDLIGEKQHYLNLEKLFTNIISSYGRHYRVNKTYK